MLHPIWIVGIHTRDFLHRYMPTNIKLNAIRERRGLKLGTPAMQLVIPDHVAGSLIILLSGRRIAESFHLLMILCIWNAFKLLATGLLCALLLARGYTTERRDRLMLLASEAPCL